MSSYQKSNCVGSTVQNVSAFVCNRRTEAILKARIFWGGSETCYDTWFGDVMDWSWLAVVWLENLGDTLSGARLE